MRMLHFYSVLRCDVCYVVECCSLSASHVLRAEYDSAAESVDSETGAPRGWDPAAHISLDESREVLPMRDFIVCKRGRSKDDYKQIVQVQLLVWGVC